MPGPLVAKWGPGNWSGSAEKNLRTIRAIPDRLAEPATIEARGEELGAIYHSHTRSAPYPSQTDVNFAAAWPGVEWLIVGLPKAGGEGGDVRSYLIDQNVKTRIEVGAFASTNGGSERVDVLAP